VHPLEVAPAEFPDGPSSPGGPGERQHGHPRVGDERGPGLGAARQHVQQPVRQPRLGEYRRERVPAADGRARIGLQHDGVAERERGRDGPDGEDQRRVEGRDDADDADGHPAGVGEPGLFAGQELPRGPGGEGGGLVALLGGDVEFEVGLAGDRTGLADEPVAQFGGVGGEQVTGLAQDGGAHEVRGGRPRPVGGVGGFGGGGDVRRAREGDGGEPFSGGGFDDGVRGAREGRPGRGVEQRHCDSPFARLVEYATA